MSSVTIVMGRGSRRVVVERDWVSALFVVKYLLMSPGERVVVNLGAGLYQCLTYGHSFYFRQAARR